MMKKNKIAGVEKSVSEQRSCHGSFFFLVLFYLSRSESFLGLINH